jgi:PAS domain S-box-containing protein
MINIKKIAALENMDIQNFTQRAEAMYGRLTNLYESSSIVPLQEDWLPEVYKELGTASEIVQLATEELNQQNEELIETRNLVELERQRYKDLFEFAPDGYLVTDPNGVIKEANYAANILLSTQQNLLVNKLIINFVPLEYRQNFRTFLTKLPDGNSKKELILLLQQRNGKSFQAALTVSIVYNQLAEPTTLRWLVRDISERKTAEIVIGKNDELMQNYPLHKYCRGETILLDPQVIWYVCQGLVKLSTICERGEEVLVGLAGEGMVFSSSMTCLTNYQAISLSDVSLVAISSTELENSPKLSRILLAKVSQRLKQTEYFLVIAGMRQVQDRLHHILQFLKKEIGQAVPGGTRLNVRLTHEDIASACGTTRVTITRIMSKLQKQRLISFDSKRHIILKDG